MDQTSVSHLTDWVNPLIGVNRPANGLPGPYLPLGLVRLSPDTLDMQWGTHGYRSDRPIRHFSHTHVSGTGGGGRYGNIGVMPFTGYPRLQLDAVMPRDETAAAGYYGVTLGDSGIRAELTATARTGVHRYRFPGDVPANVLIDAGCVIQLEHHVPGDNTGSCIGGFIEWTGPREVVGRGDYRGGWGHDYPYSVYFCARFDRDVERRLSGSASGPFEAACVCGVNCRAVAGFGCVPEVNLQVGISYVSLAKARASLDREAAGCDFDTLRERARATWDAALSRIVVEGGSRDQQTLFYTLFTRLLAMPTDLGVDDECGLWQSGVRHFTDFYCLWDSVRNANSLIGLFDPELEVAFLNCLLDVARHTGWLQDAWVAGHAAMVQGGSSADILLCEAALKGFAGIDYPNALLQMRKNNEAQSPDPYLHGRYLDDYHGLGYVSTAVTRCASRHLEYAYQDWCIGTLAAHLGDHPTAERYFESSRKVWNLWRPDKLAFCPRRPDGGWVEPFDPSTCVKPSWLDPYFYEGTSRQWSWSVLHDIAGLIARMGGPSGFVAQLDTFFDSGQYHSKESMLHVPWLYHYAGRPDKSAQRVRWALETYFKPTRDGLSDNEDMGCQSAFYMCSTMGLYPVMGQDLYLLAAPVFPRTTITLGTSGAELMIEAPAATAGHHYVAAARLNGKPLDRAWIRHAELARGAHLEFELTDEPGAWGQAVPPPSPLTKENPTS